jgi:peptidoglycan/LPS O-acetylase OafA/YrhL
VKRRFVRLAPVVTALVLVGGPVLVLFGALPAREVARDGVISLLQGTAFTSVFGAEPVVPFRPTWSLTVEWTFYLLFPLALIALRRRKAGERTVLRALVVAAGLLYGAGLLLPPQAFYLLPVANVGVLVAGAALATWHRIGGVDRRRVDPARTGMALLLLVILVFLPGYTLGWGWKVVVMPAATAGTLVLIHGCWAANSASRILAWRPLRTVGLRAYSLYLWHMPVMWLVWVNLQDSSRWVQAVVSLAAITVLTHVSFELLERPVLRSRVPGGTRRRREPATLPAVEGSRTPAA